MSKQSRPQVPALTGLRALAAYLVFFHHFSPSSLVVGSLGFCMFREGHAGVSIFFVLSGFVIAYNYTDQFASGNKGYGRYLQNRFARIYPIFFLSTAVALSYLGDFNVRVWFYNLTFLRGFFGQWYFYQIGQAWSLSVEFCFYLLAPFLLRAVGKIPLGVLCLFFYGLGATLSLAPSPMEGFFNPYRMVAVNTFFGRCFEFLIGIWLFKYFRESTPQKSLLHRFGICTYLGIILLIFCFYIFAKCTGLAVYSPDCSPIHHFVLPPICALLIYGLWKERTFLSWLFSNRVALLLGQSSYVFYLIHAAPFQGMLRIEEQPLMIKFLVIQLISILIYLAIERPLHRFFRFTGTNSSPSSAH